LGCKGRLDEYQSMQRDMCACKDRECVRRTRKEFEARLARPPSWFEKTFVSKSAEVAMQSAFDAANACADPVVPPPIRCAGESGPPCPKDMICVGGEETEDGMGRCVPILAEGASCIVPGDPCGPG